MERYLCRGRPSNYRIVAVVGVENSPSCGVTRVSRTVGGKAVTLPGRGHLVDALEADMRCRGIDVPMIGVSLKPGEREDGVRKLEALCSQGD